MNNLRQLSNFTFPGTNLSLDSMALLRDLDTLVCSIIVLCSEGLELMFETTDHSSLGMKLGFKILSQSCNASLISSSSSFNIINLSSESCKISIVEFMSLNLIAIGVNNSLSESLTHLSKIMDTSVFLCNLLVFEELTFFSLSSMLLVVAERWSR